MRWHLDSSRRRRLLVATAAISLAGLIAPQPALSHPEGPGNHKPMPVHATPAMRAFVDDHHHADPIEAASGQACIDGLAAGTFPCDNIDLEAFLPIAEIGGTSGQSALNDIWGWTDPVTGREYALIGRVFGTSFVDVTNPTDPRYLGELPTHGSFGSDWRDIKTFANHAFIVSEARRHGMQVFDLTQLRGLDGTNPVTFSETAHYNRVSSAHNIFINEDSGVAYIVGAAGRNGCDGGLHMVDIANPTNPRRLGCFAADGYTHDVQCVIYDGPDTEHRGKEICLASNEDTITIVDVTDTSNPVQLSRTGYAGADYTHQGWLTDDHVYFLVDDELDEFYQQHNTRTRVFDVSDLDAPTLTGIFDGTTPAIDHNQYIHNGYSFQANYRAGLRVIDLAGIAEGSLAEVAFFDVYPDDDAAQFNGAWSNYPFFDSGIVIVSGIEQGLFVLRPNLPTTPSDSAPSVSIVSPTDGSIVNGTVTIEANASDDNGVTSVEFFADGISLGVDVDAPYTFNWDSTHVGDGPTPIIALATDTAGQTRTASVSVEVDNVADEPIHVGDLDASTAPGRGGKWSATVTITVVDSTSSPVAGVSVTGGWSAGDAGSVSCTTDALGQCAVASGTLSRKVPAVTFSVTALGGDGLSYDAGANTDPDGDSDGTSIELTKP